MTAREFADALAKEIGGALRVLRDDDDHDQFVIVTVDGRAPVMVRKYLSGTIGACVPGALAHAGGESTFDAARVATFREAAFTWLRSHPKALSMFGVAIALADALADLGRWDFRIPSPTDPDQLRLHTADASSIGVSDCRVHLDRTYQIQTRADLDEALPRIRGEVKQSVIEIAAYREASTQLEAATKIVATKLAAGTSLPATPGYVDERRGDLLLYPITCGGRPVMIKLDMTTGALRIHAGIAGQGDVEVSYGELDARMPEVVAALARARATLTVGDLRINARYRVLAKVGELSAGDEVTYKGLDDIDNHYGEYLFDRVDGKRLVVGGDCSTPERGPLGRAHEYLAVIE
jgi:hypothetical protein